MSADAAPTFSVLIANRSRIDSARILEVLEGLATQSPAVPHEVIVAYTEDAPMAACIGERFPHVRRIACPAGTPLPALRTLALEQARGRYVAVTEDHCVPCVDWLARFEAAFASASAEVVAVGGAIVNGVSVSLLDRATFACEYGRYAPPRGDGCTSDIPGMNVAYVRRELLALDPASLTAGFWETTAHPALLRGGMRFAFREAIRVEHRKAFTLAQYLRQRFLYSRHFAGTRFAAGERGRRLAACVLSPLLVPLLLWRFHGQALRRPHYMRAFIPILPYLFVFAGVCAAGEMLGYARGAAEALRELE